MNQTTTPREQAILDFLRGNVIITCHLSMREIAAGVGLASSSTIFHHLVQLERKGYIIRNPLQSRSIRLVDPAEAVTA